MRRVIIESPYAASGDKTVTDHTQYATMAMRDCLRRGEAPFASHLLYTRFLDDLDPSERHQGMTAGHAWYRGADLCVVYMDHGMSGGMAQGVRMAIALDVAVEYRRLDAELFLGEWTRRKP